MSPRQKAFGRPRGRIFADLHLHSNQSDGTDSPAAVVKRAASLGLRAIALTDHDTMAGNREAAAAAEKQGIAFICGVEVSANCAGIEVHVLGLAIGEGGGELEEKLEAARHERYGRIEQIVGKLQGLGVDLKTEDVEAEVGGAQAPGRLHVARAMYRMGVTKSTQAAFTKFIGVGKPAYVPKQRMPASDAVDLIHGSGGIAILAHPGIGGVEKKLAMLLALPFDGIEVWHPEHSSGQCETFATLARENQLIATGGSDDHGSKTERQFMGKSGLDESGYQAVVARLSAAK